MIESIEDFRVLLRRSYNEICSKLNVLRVGHNAFQTIMSEHLITDGNLNPLNLLQSYDKTNSPVRMQLKDISGIAANSLGHYISNVWAIGNLDPWAQILVVPVRELVETDITLNIHKICTEYVKDNLRESIIDESFFKNTLFIISGCSELSAQAVSNLETLAAMGCNILVLSDATKLHTCLIDKGYIVHQTGLKSPQGIIKFDNGEELSINGLEVFKIAEKARDFGFSTSLKPGSVIDHVSNLVIDMTSGNMVLRGREHKVPHNIKFVIDFDELIQQLHADTQLITNKYMAIAPHGTKDWFTAATTSQFNTGDIKTYTYNIGGRIITRNLTTNYLSYVGKVKDVMDNIIAKIACTLNEEYANIEVSGPKKTIPKERWLEIASNKVRAELYKNSYIDVRNLKSDADHPGGILTTVDTQVSDILPGSTIREPSYRELNSRLQSKNNTDFSKMLRMILENCVDEGANIPEELYVLAACLFIAEVGRNPSTFLPSLMLIDLAEQKHDIWNWATIISQESILDSDVYDPFGVIARSYGDFRGMHPMTHDGSYFQSYNICTIPLGERSNLLSLVEYKTSVIMLDWLELSCEIKPMEASYSAHNDAEIFPRFTGRLARTSLIDKNIDILQCEELGGKAHEDLARKLVEVVDEKFSKFHNFSDYVDTEFIDKKISGFIEQFCEQLSLHNESEHDLMIQVVFKQNIENLMRECIEQVHELLIAEVRYEVEHAIVVEANYMEHCWF